MRIDKPPPLDHPLPGTAPGDAPRARAASRTRAEEPGDDATTPSADAAGGPTVFERVAMATAGAGFAVLGGTGAASMTLNGYGIVTLGAIVSALGGGSGLLATGLGIMAGSVLPLVGGVVVASRLFRAAAQTGTDVDS
jgi:hypothetical protein